MSTHRTARPTAGPDDASRRQTSVAQRPTTAPHVFFRLSVEAVGRDALPRAGAQPDIALVFNLDD